MRLHASRLSDIYCVREEGSGLRDALQQPVHGLATRDVKLRLKVRHLTDHVHDLLLPINVLGQEGHLEDGQQPDGRYCIVSGKSASHLGNSSAVTLPEANTFLISAISWAWHSLFSSSAALIFIFVWMRRMALSLTTSSPVCIWLNIPIMAPLVSLLISVMMLFWMMVISPWSSDCSSCTNTSTILGRFLMC